MSRIITKNRDPRLNEFGPDDLVLNTSTGDLFLKANNQLFKILGRNQFDQTTTDALLKLIDESAETEDIAGQIASFKGFKIAQDGFYSLQTSNPITGSGVSLHGAIPFDYGQPLPNSPYIKTNGGFDILMDNAGVHNNSSFRIFRDTAVPGLFGTELLKVDDNGNLTVAGTISGSSITATDIDGGSF
jgi:hypothetical protein